MKQASRPYRNQKLFRNPRKQQQVLEVTLRADKERRRQIRRFTSVFTKVILLAAASAGLWVGTKVALRRLIWENRYFNVSELHVTTDGSLTRDQILATAGVVEGRNILLYDMRKVRGALDALPQVERVDVERTLPNRIDIEINERQPIAWIAAPGEVDPTASEHSYLVDARGYVMRTRKIQPEFYSLPIITGAETENLVPGQKVKAFELQAALELLHSCADNTRWQVGSVDVSKGYCLVVTDRNHAKVTFPLENIDRELAKLYRLLDVIEPAHQIRTVNLFVEHNTPVTFAEPGSDDSADAADEAPAPPPVPVAEIVKPPEKTPGNKAKENKSKAAATPSAKKADGPVKVQKKPFRLQGNG